MRPFAARRPLFYKIITQTTWTNRPAARLFRYQGRGRADADRFGPALPGCGGQALQRGVCAPFGLPCRERRLCALRLALPLWPGKNPQGGKAASAARHHMKKKPTLYIIVFAVWAGCAALLAVCLAQLLPAVAGEPWRRGLIAALLALNTAILAALWLGSIKDLVFSLAYALRRKALTRALQRQAAEGDRASAGAQPLPRVLLLYCTCNDFNEQALSRCRRQNYGNCKTVILDDSTDPAYKRAAAKYALHHSNVEVVRRQDRSGYKAGNLNNYLRGRSDYDYFVVLDSDEVIPPDFISKALRYFAADENCGAVQARHVASEGKNMFQRLLGRSVAGNGRTVQVIKNFYGANALLGHGMMISRRCYQRAGGFPHVVAEDISFAVEIRNAGLSILYAPDIECSEEFPSSYLALKKRQCKWTQGNLEYMKRYSGQIFSAKMAWFEKADIILSHYSLPVVPVLSFLLTVCTVALGFLGYPVIGYALAVYAVMLLFLCSPMLPDLFLCRGKTNFCCSCLTLSSTWPRTPPSRP